jgi:WD40 repeat protein
VWDVSTGEPGPLLRHSGTTQIWAAFSPDGRRVVVRSAAGPGAATHLFDAATGQELVSKPSWPDYRPAFSSDGRRYVTVSGPDVAVWDAMTGKPILPSAPRVHQHEVIDTVFSPDGRHVVTTSYDATARIWDATTGKEAVTTAPRHGGSVASARFSPDGRWIVTGSADQTARVWDAATGEPVSPPLPHSGSVFLASFAPDGRRVLTASGDGTVRIWDLATDENVVPPLRRQAARDSQ